MTTYPATAPFIVAQPQNLTVGLGQNATFTVFAGGSAGLNYQWYFNTNTPVSNATNAVLMLTSVAATNAGVYSVVFNQSGWFRCQHKCFAGIIRHHAGHAASVRVGLP